MKKIALLFITIGVLLSLSACAGRGTGTSAETPEQEKESAAETPEPEKESAAEIPEQEKESAAEIPESGTEPAAETVRTEKDMEEEAESVVIYEHEDIYLSVSLPDTWECGFKTVEDMEKENEDDRIICSIDFWPKANPEAVFSLEYCQQFGICGTGVTEERLELSSGLAGNLCYEKYQAENALWMMFFFDRTDESQEDGIYIVEAFMELSLWEQAEPEFLKILDSVWVGQHTEPTNM